MSPPTCFAVSGFAAAPAQLFPFDRTGDSGRPHSVWHCHIIDHEDNEMMWPHIIQPNTLAERPVKKGRDY